MQTTLAELQGVVVRRSGRNRQANRRRQENAPAARPGTGRELANESETRNPSEASNSAALRVWEDILAEKANLLGRRDLRVNVNHVPGLVEDLLELRNSG